MPQQTPEQLLAWLKMYGQHKPNCGALGVMWDKEPCDCGWHQVKEDLGFEPDRDS
jgi:hypothetical protein